MTAHQILLRKLIKVIPVLLLVTALIALPKLVFAQTSIPRPPKPPKIRLTIPKKPSRPVCGFSVKGNANCTAHVVTQSDNITPLTGSQPLSGSFGPHQLHTAYNLPCAPGGAVQSNCNTPGSFGSTIAIVDAYNDPTLVSDLGSYDSYFHLPTCTQANGCLSIVNQNGTTALPASDSNWSLEISLDVETAHALCQTCKLLLVEASSSSMSTLATAVNTAARLGAVAISNSYGGPEWNGESYFDSYYNHPGIAITASSGDNGYGTMYPAASSKVISVGGTQLHLNTDYTYSDESAWSQAGSGCSLYESASSWQMILRNWIMTKCGSKRAIADISADADPSTGVAIYDSTPYSGASGWFQVGGTSLASPIIASIYALSNNKVTDPLSQLYSLVSKDNSHDVITGSNGSCSTVMCLSGIGYDGPTGLGSPFGTGLFSQTNPVNTPTPTTAPTQTPPPSISPSPTPTSFSVNITNPQNNSTVSRYQFVPITVDPGTNKITKIAFYINGLLYYYDFTAPYNYNWFVTGSSGTKYTIMVKAYTTNGNITTDTVNLSVK